MPAWHAPVARSHLSIPLHASPSSHWASELQQPSIGVLGLLTQLPVPGSQLSSVQTLPSSQFGGGPPTQLPFLQASSVVQASPSLQAVPLAFAGFEHVPVAGLQVPAVWH